MEAVIVSGGEIKDYSFYKDILKDKYIICADGGIHHLKMLGITPDLFLGDFDSCDYSQIEKSGIIDGAEIEKYKIEKDATDTHIAVDTAIKKGFDTITIIGALGGRYDHALANIFLLKYMLEKGVLGKIVNEKNEIFITDKPLDIMPRDGKKLSLIPLCNNVLGITLKNLKYPLYDFNLKMGDTIGISNEFTDKKASITFKEGILLVVISND